MIQRRFVAVTIVSVAILTGFACGQQPSREAPLAPPKHAFDPAELRRFTEGAMYLGQHETGPYPGSKNEMPEAHRKAGEQVAAAIKPLDADGRINEKEGRILGLVLGHSNCAMYFGALERHFRAQRRLLHPRLELVNAAVGGQQLPQIVTLQGGVWDRARSLLEDRPGYSRRQVQVLFLHTTYHGAGNPGRVPPRPFPENMRHMERDLEKVLAYCVERFPNLRIAYLTCDGFRHYTHFEPHVYQEAFALKWLIERQIKGEPPTRYEGPDRRLPWLTWGPYIWDNAWDKSYFTDGVHPAPKALEIFVDKYWQHLCRDSVAEPWLFPPIPSTGRTVPASQVREILGRLPSPRGIISILGDPRAELAIELAKASELQAYLQLPDEKDVEAARRAADAAGLLNSRVYIEKGSDRHIDLADNLADAVVVCAAAGDRAVKADVLRVLRPGGTAWLGPEILVRPAPTGTDEWSHPYHRADNNPQSTDQLARAPYLTQFLAEPWYCPMPEMTVAAGGRVFKAFGSRAFLRPQWPVLNTLIAMNGYNGTILWKWPLDPNFMIHRNTLIATADTLYLGDATSCKLFDAATGAPKGLIRVPEGISDGPTWKWMALEDGILYALVGEKEPPGDNLQGQGFRGAGWPWWTIARYGWGFGRTLLAIDVATQKVLWHHREPEPLDTRAVCMKAGRIYFYCHPKYLGCVDAKTGKLVWKSDDRAVLEAIGDHHPCQFPATGFATSAYMKCGEDALYFAGPQRTKLVAVSTADGWIYAFEAAGGRLLWRFRAAPAARKIPVYGSLSSTWPVASGVLVDGPVAYAAAGIANYDGTHVYALDAATGKIRWQNNTSGITEGGQGSGASVQGDLLLHGGKLYLAGGNRVPLASYDAASGAFQPVRPVTLPYAKDPRGPRGPSLFLRGDGKVAVSGTFPLYTRPEDMHYIDQAELPSPPATLAVTTGGLGLVLPAQSEGAKAKPIWAARVFDENVAVAVAKNAVVLAGTDRRVRKPQASPEEAYGLAALDIRSGKVLWKNPLPAGPVRWGVAIDRNGRVLVSLRDGRVLCFGEGPEGN